MKQTFVNIFSKLNGADRLEIFVYYTTAAERATVPKHWC